MLKLQIYVINSLENFYFKRLRESRNSNTIDLTGGSIQQLPLLEAQLPQEHNATLAPFRS